MIGFSYLIGLCVLALPLSARESIILKTGFELSADRYEVDGATMRIFSEGGVAEIPASLVTRIDHVDDPVPAPKAEPAPAVKPPAPLKPLPADLSPAALAENAAQKYSLPAEFVTGVMRAESGLNPAAVSPKGAVGLMQLMPDTARELGADPGKPAENADAGARYLRDLLAKYENDPNQVVLALAAYNAGPAAVEKYHGVPPYRETREYILRVLKAWKPALAVK
ncbi:MAG TPA: lytic transglycosylase domain-containing protein [Bryobacteraceae bacterium]|nr:lytic transglycosylase domain-containing protein [Bryobacteraceae bacterium]